MSQDEQSAYLRDVIDKLNKLAYDHQDTQFIDYVGRLTNEALQRVAGAGRAG